MSAANKYVVKVYFRHPCPYSKALKNKDGYLFAAKTVLSHNSDFCLATISDKFKLYEIPEVIKQITEENEYNISHFVILPV